MAFFSLPAELRFQVYHYIAVPNVTQFYEYRGLYLSCKRIKAEIDQEGTKAINSCVAALNADMHDVHITIASGLPSLHLRLTLDASVHRHTYERDYEGLFHQVLNLHIAALTIHTDLAAPRRQRMYEQIVLLEKIFLHNNHNINAHQITLDFGHLQTNELAGWPNFHGWDMRLEALSGWKRKWLIDGQRDQKSRMRVNFGRVQGQRIKVDHREAY